MAYDYDLELYVLISKSVRNSLIISPSNPNPLSSIDLVAKDTLNIAVRFYEQNPTNAQITQLDLGSGIVVGFAGRAKTALDEAPLFVATGFTYLSDSSDYRYEGTLNLNTTAIETALTGGKASVELLCGIELSNAGNTLRKTACQFTGYVLNDAFRDTDTDPIPAAPTYPDPSVVTTTADMLKAGAGALYVNANTGDDPTGVKGRPDRPFASISAAVAAAVEGDYIYVAPGDYEDEQDWNKNLTVILDEGAIVTVATGESLIVMEAEDFMILGQGGIEIPATSKLEDSAGSNGGNSITIYCKHFDSRNTSIAFLDGATEIHADVFRAEDISVSGTATFKLFAKDIYLYQDAAGGLITHTDTAISEIHAQNLYANSNGLYYMDVNNTKPCVLDVRYYRAITPGTIYDTDESLFALDNNGSKLNILPGVLSEDLSAIPAYYAASPSAVINAFGVEGVGFTPIEDPTSTGTVNIKPVGGGSTWSLGLTAYVCETNGNNGTAVIGRPDKPYATITAALAAITPGTHTVVVMPGEYDENELWRDGATLHLMEGVHINDTTGVSGNDGVFGGSTPTDDETMLVTGLGEITTTGSLAYLEAPGLKLDLHARKVTAAAELIAILEDDLEINLHVAETLTFQPFDIGGAGCELNASADRLVLTGATGGWDVQNGSKLRLNANKLTTNHKRLFYCNEADSLVVARIGEYTTTDVSDGSTHTMIETENTGRVLLLGGAFDSTFDVNNLHLKTDNSDGIHLVGVMKLGDPFSGNGTDIVFHDDYTPQAVSAGEKTAGTETSLRQFSPKDIHDMVDAHAPGGGGASLDIVLVDSTYITANTKLYPVTGKTYVIEEDVDLIIPAAPADNFYFDLIILPGTVVTPYESDETTAWDPHSTGGATTLTGITASALFHTDTGWQFTGLFDQEQPNYLPKGTDDDWDALGKPLIRASAKKAPSQNITSNGTANIDLEAGNWFDITLGAGINITSFSFSNLPDDGVVYVTVRATNWGAGGTITWNDGSTAFVFDGGSNFDGDLTSDGIDEFLLEIERTSGSTSSIAAFLVAADMG